MNRGFALLLPLIIIGILILGIAGGALYGTFKNRDHVEKAGLEQREVDYDTLLRDASDKLNKSTKNIKDPASTSTPTKTPYKVPSTLTPTLKPFSPTYAPNPDPTGANSTYDTVSATGAVKVVIVPSSGTLIGDQLVELHASAPVLDGGNYSQTLIARWKNHEVTFSQAPGGYYTVKVRYKDYWLPDQGVNVSSGQLSTVSFSTAGDNPTPTPTPAINLTCAIANSPSSGNSPLDVQFYSSASYTSPSSHVSGAQWDFDGDGSWDTDFGWNSGFTHTYSTPGNFGVRMQVKLNTGEISPVCTTMISVS